MPYQDIEDIAVIEPARSPSVVVRWLRKLFVEDWGIKLLALGITLALWLAVSDLNKPRTIRTAVQLNFILPSNMDISNETPKTVEVELTGSRERLNSMKLLDLVATLDISDTQAGERVIRLLPERVQMELPTGVKIDSFRPTTIPVRLELNVERQLPVEIKLDGQPADGYEVVRSSAQPGTVTVRGPASLVENLKQAPTETISIAGRNESFTANRVVIDVSDQKIDLLTPVVDVTIDIEQKKNTALPVSSALAERLVAEKVTRRSNQSILTSGKTP